MSQVTKIDEENFLIFKPKNKCISYLLYGFSAAVIVASAVVMFVRKPKCDLGRCNFKLGNLLFILIVAGGCVVGYLSRNLGFISKYALTIFVLSSLYTSVDTRSYCLFDMQNHSKNSWFVEKKCIFILPHLAMMAAFYNLVPTAFALHFTIAACSIVGAGCFSSIVSDSRPQFIATALVTTLAAGFGGFLLASSYMPISLLSLEFLAAYSASTLSLWPLFLDNSKYFRHFSKVEKSSKRVAEFLLTFSRRLSLFFLPINVWNDGMANFNRIIPYRRYRPIPVDMFDPEIMVRLEEDRLVALRNYLDEKEKNHLREILNKY